MLRCSTGREPALPTQCGRWVSNSATSSAVRPVRHPLSVHPDQVLGQRASARVWIAALLRGNRMTRLPAAKGLRRPAAKLGAGRITGHSGLTLSLTGASNATFEPASGVTVTIDHVEAERAASNMTSCPSTTEIASATLKHPISLDDIVASERFKPITCAGIGCGQLFPWQYVTWVSDGGLADVLHATHAPPFPSPPSLAVSTTLVTSTVGLLGNSIVVSALRASTSAVCVDVVPSRSVAVADRLTGPRAETDSIVPANSDFCQLATSDGHTGRLSLVAGSTPNSYPGAAYLARVVASTETSEFAVLPVAVAVADFTGVDCSGVEEMAIVAGGTAEGVEFCGGGPTIPTMMNSTTKTTGNQNHQRFQSGFFERGEASGGVEGAGSSGDRLKLSVIRKGSRSCYATSDGRATGEEAYAPGDLARHWSR
jgi:hypothetical protein